MSEQRRQLGLWSNPARRIPDDVLAWSLRQAGDITSPMAPLRCVPLGCLLLLFLFVCSCKRGTAATEAEAPKPVRVEPVGRHDVLESVDYAVDLEPETEVRVFSRIPDRILSFPWRDGDRVSRGERIAIIRSEGMARGMDQVAAQIDAIEIQIRNQKSELDRAQELLRTGAIPQSAYDRVESAYKASVAQRDALKAGRMQIAASAGDAVITAPISGVIASKMLEVGDIAAPQVPLCRILSIEKLKVRVGLVETDVARVRAGQEATVVLDAFPGRQFRGEVKAVMPYLDAQTRTNTAEIELMNPKDETGGQYLLKPGMFGRAEIVVAQRAKALVAPERALLLDDALSAKSDRLTQLRKAFVVEPPSVVRERVVRLGVRNGEMIEILDGLAEGDRLVVRGQHGLRDGQVVQVVER